MAGAAWNVFGCSDVVECGLMVVPYVGKIAGKAYKGYKDYKRLKKLQKAEDVGSALSPYEKGKKAAGWSKDAALTRGEDILGEEVDLTFTVNGRSVGLRADVLTRRADGQYVYIESKYSPKASYTTNQRVVIPALVRSGDGGMTATVGARSGLLTRGQQINVVFQGDVWNSGPSLYGH